MRDRCGGWLLHLITGLCPSYGQVYSMAERPDPCNVFCNVLAMLSVTFFVMFFSYL